MKRRSWILFLLCLLVFVALRLLPVMNKSTLEIKKAKPAVPEPVLVESSFLSHPWVLAQPCVSKVNVEMERDLAAFNELCEAVARQRSDWTQEQIQSVLIKTLTSLQKEIPFELPQELYSVYCISEAPHDWVRPPVPFHVYKRLYLGDMELGLPCYLDVRVFELGSCSTEELIQWHLELLDGEAKPLIKSQKRAAYLVSGERRRETAHGFAKGVRGLFIDCLERDGRFYVLYAEAPIKVFEENRRIFMQLTQRSYDE